MLKDLRIELFNSIRDEMVIVLGNRGLYHYNHLGEFLGDARIMGTKQIEFLQSRRLLTAEVDQCLNRIA